jgi:hypothetical protein
MIFMVETSLKDNNTSVSSPLTKSKLTETWKNSKTNCNIKKQECMKGKFSNKFSDKSSNKFSNLRIYQVTKLMNYFVNGTPKHPRYFV